MKKFLLLAVVLTALFTTPALAAEEGVNEAYMAGAIGAVATDTLLFHSDPFLNSWERATLSSATGLFSGAIVGLANGDADLTDTVVAGAISATIAGFTSEMFNSSFFVSTSGEQWMVGFTKKF